MIHKDKITYGRNKELNWKDRNEHMQNNREKIAARPYIKFQNSGNMPSVGGDSVGQKARREWNAHFSITPGERMPRSTTDICQEHRMIIKAMKIQQWLSMAGTYTLKGWTTDRTGQRPKTRITRRKKFISAEQKEIGTLLM